MRLAWWESGEIDLLEIALDPAYTILAVAVLAIVAFTVTIGIRATAKFDASRAVQTLLASQVAETQDARATIYPLKLIGDPQIGALPGTFNCSGGQWCDEKIIAQEDTDGYHYTGYATLHGTAGHVEVVTFSTTGLDSGGAPQNVTITGRITLAPTDSLAYASIPVTSLATDARNPAASVAAAYQSAIGAAPVVREIKWGPNFVIGTNNTEIAKWSVAGISGTTGMAISTLPAKNIAITVGFATPTPLPSFSPETPLVFHWPSTQAGVGGAAPGPTAFSVHMYLYHDAYFAEGAPCAKPSPQYVPGSSPTYVPGMPPSGMFGTSGPWVYPNPNPLSPPNQDSGPATFGVAPSSAGVCSIPVYTTYTPRSGPILAGEPTPFPQQVQVMGWLTLSYNSSSATSQTSPLAIGAALTNIGDSVTVAASKTLDDDVPELTPVVSFDATCSSYLSAAVGAPAMSGSGQTASESSPVTFSVKAANKTGSPITCGGSVTDQYNEPPVSFTLSIQPTSTMKTWPGNLVIAVDGNVVTTTNAQVASSGTMGIAWSQFVNRVFGGGTALAASSAPCYAKAMQHGSTTTLDTPTTTDAHGNYAITIGSYELGVSTDGCEIYSADGGSTWTPVGASGAAVAQPLQVEYESDGTTSGSWSQRNTCAGIALPSTWYPAQTGARTSLPWSGSATGTCTVTYSDGTSSSTPVYDAGLADITVEQTYFLVGHVAYTSARGATTSDCVSNCLVGNPSASGGGTGIKGCVYYHIDCGGTGGYNEYDEVLVGESSSDGGTTMTSLAECDAEADDSTGSWTRSISGQCSSSSTFNGSSTRDAIMNVSYTPPGGAWTYVVWPIGVSSATVPSGPLDLDGADHAGDYIWPACAPSSYSKGMTVYGTNTVCP